MATRPIATPADLAGMLTYRMHLLHKLTDQESQRRYLEEAGLSLSDGRCLSTIGAFEPISVNALAQMANLNKAQASRAAQALVDQGLVDKAGSASDGRGVLPFHANLLQAAISTESPVQPVVLRYRDAHSAISAAPAYVGDTSLAASLWATVTADKLVAEVCVENAQGARHADRRALAEHLREIIVGRLEEGRA